MKIKRKKIVIIGLILLIVPTSAVVIRQMTAPISKSAVVSGPGVQPSLKSPSGLLPEIASAEIIPGKPRSDTPLIVKYISGGPSNDSVQCRFRWYVNNEIVQDGESAILNPGTYKKGMSVFVEVTTSNNSGAGQPYKTEPVIIDNTPPTVTSISLKPSPALPGDVLTAMPEGRDPDGDAVSYHYQWIVNGEPVNETQQDSNTLNTKGLQKKDNICVIVTPFDGESSGKQKLSDLLLLSNTPPRITSLPPDGLENGVYIYRVTAADADGDALVYSLAESPAGMTIDSKTGLIRWEPPQKTPGTVDPLVKIVVDDGDGGKETQEYSLFLNMQ
jgi:hypothetical protein